MGWRIFNIAKILRLNGHDVDVVHYILNNKVYEKLKSESYNQDFIKNTSLPLIHFEHLKKLLSQNYDLVYGNTYSGTFSSILGKLTNTPLIYDMHGGLSEEFLIKNKINFANLPLYFFDKTIDFINLRYANKIICVSKTMIKYLHDKKGVPLEKMEYITNGVDLDLFKPIDNDKVRNMRNQLGISNKIVFGYIGGFHKWQGVESFIEAARKINNPDIAFLIVGGMERSKENNIIFIPKITRDQIPFYYSICDVLVLPRPSHPATEIAAPTKFAEYAAMGKPILTTNVGDAANFVSEYECGTIIENNKTENLVGGILAFKDKSAEELKRMGKNSRTLAENEFDWNKVGISLSKFLELSVI